jgi:hypothetical protein
MDHVDILSTDTYNNFTFTNPFPERFCAATTPVACVGQ